MYHIRNGQNVRWTNTECACGTRLGNSVTCPAVDRSQFRSNGHQRIHIGYLQDAERMRTGKPTRTGQTAYQRTSNVHPPDIFIQWRPFEVLDMYKNCQRIGPDKTDITWHVTHSRHEERTRHACKRTENFTVRYASDSAIRWGVTVTLYTEPKV